jgi:CRISPR-associated protein Csm2
MQLMTANRPKHKPQPNQTPENKKNSKTSSNQSSILDTIKEEIKTSTKEKGFSAYPIRKLVAHSEEFGFELKKQNLKTNQIRKFLDAVNKIKATINEKTSFQEIEAEVVLLKPKLAYAASRERTAKSLSEVLSNAIDNVKSIKDFKRLVEFIESIIAYHKAAGGD